MINFKNCIYVNQVTGNDDNTGQINHPVKSFVKAKEIISENGLIYILGKYDTKKIEFISDKQINVFGYNEDSEIIYYSDFGDHISILKNIDFYKIKMTVGDTRYNFEPKMEGNFYNCIINMNGSMYDNYTNCYNCVFIKSNTKCNYSSYDSRYWVHGIYENCVFNKKYFNDESDFKNIYKNKETNVFLDDIEDVTDTKITERGVYFGKFKYYFSVYFIFFNNRIYKLSNESELVNSDLNDSSNDTIITSINKKIIDFIDDRYNIIKVRKP